MGVNSLNFFDELYNQAVNKSDEFYDDKRDSRKGDSDGILKTPDYAHVSTDTSPTDASQTEEVVTQSPNRIHNNSSDDLGSSGASPKGVDATLYDDDYESKGEDFVDFNQLFEFDHINNLDSSVLRRSNRQHKMPAKFDNYVLDKRVKYDINFVVNYSNLSIETFVFSNNMNKIHEPKTFVEAANDPRWVEAMNQEMEALNSNKTWEITYLPKDRKAI
ncbi:hypothetical protein Tco_0093788 [Tanacetum coccineum]